MSPAGLIAFAAGRGVTLLVEDGRLKWRSSGRPLDAGLRELLIDHHAELFAHLTPAGSEPWDQARAIVLMSDADDRVGESGVSGTHPDVRAIAGRACERYYAHDLPGLRAACEELRAILHRLKPRVPTSLV
jgi:hypothetical protein